ncbi:MAG: PLP-dependent aminotransferase family protein [Lysobacterales bacterium]
MKDYRAIADALAADIAAGRLAPGSRLPPQRQFADQQGIAASTASRVYAELARRGLITGEVGRGSYVRSALATPPLALSEPTFAPIDLEMNIPLLPQANTELAAALASVAQAEALQHALRPIGAAATPQARQIAAEFLARGRWQPDPSTIHFTGNGRQAIAAALRALATPGERIGVEALTYPVIKGLARQLGITLVPLEMDAQGLLPAAVLAAHQSAPLRGLYLQPTLHNPLGCTMDAARRQAMADALEQTDLIAIEDAIYAFLADEPPLAALAPERVIHVDSFSKRIAPGMTLGYAVVPPACAARFTQAVRANGTAAAGLPLALGLQLMADGAANRIAAFKRDDATARQQIARGALAGLDLRGDPRAYHLWLTLPDHWRAERFVAAAARQGIAIAPGSAFAVAPGHAPNAIRIALSAPPVDQLRYGLCQLYRLIVDGDMDFD